MSEPQPAAKEEQVFTFGAVSVTGVPTDGAVGAPAAGAPADAVDQAGGAAQDVAAGSGSGSAPQPEAEGDAAPAPEAEAGAAAEPEQKHVYPADVCDLDPSREWLEYVGTRGVKMTRMAGLEPLAPKLEHLSFRSNLLRKMEGVQTLTSLTHLDLYDNQLQKLKHTDALVSLQILDLSFNEIRKVPDLSHLPLLRELYVANNKLTKVEGLGGLAQLQKLDLGANRIRVMEGFEALHDLKELWLGKNKITEMGGLEALTSLQRLSVQSNRMIRVSGLDACAALEELYLSHNGIEELGPDALPPCLAQTLNTLDVGTNRITSLANVGHLVSLTDLWANGNLVADFDDLNGLTQLTSLDTLYLEHNPLAKDFEYRLRIARLLNSLTQLDADPVTRPDE